MTVLIIALMILIMQKKVISKTKNEIDINFLLPKFLSNSK